MAFDRVYDTDAADLWETLTDPERLARWLARVDGDLREGGRLHLTHTRLAASSAAGYAAGWDVYLRRLDEFVAGREVRDTWSEDWGSAHEGHTV